MRHLLLGFNVELVNLQLFIINDRLGVIFAVKLVVLQISDEVAKSNRVLLPHEVKLARLSEVHLDQALLKILLLLSVAHLEDLNLRIVTLVQFNSQLV